MKKKDIKYIIIGVVILLVGLFSLLIYKNLFAESNDTRYKDLDKYPLTNNEISAIKDKVNELENVDSIDVYTDSKIIKILVKLSEDIDFKSVKDKANETISNISEDNLTYYDVEFFVDSLNEESEVYPKIGYKFKTKSEFSW